VDGQNTAAEVVAPALDLPEVELVVERRPDGVILLQSATPLVVEHRSLPRALAAQAERIPGKTHLAERLGPEFGWRRQTFGKAKAEADAVAQWLLDRNIAAGQPVLVVSGNSIAHATVRYGAMAAGVPVCPVSVNYALMGAQNGYDRLRFAIDLVRPAVIFAETAAFAPALAAVAPAGVPIVTRDPEAFGPDAVAYDAVLATSVTDAVRAAIEGADVEAPAAYMLTSGSTGRPKAVVHSQRMLMASVYQGHQALGQYCGWTDELLDWLPWNHVSGTTTAFAALTFGGSLFIDDGKPVPGAFAETLRNLREVPVRYLTNVPVGFAMLADALEKDDGLRRAVFENVHILLYGGAGLPQPIYDRLQALAVKTTGRRVFLSTGYGSTETTSGFMSIYFHSDRVGVGLPLPGAVAKLVPTGDLYEVRVKGPMVMSGYLDAPAANTAAFDEEGFYRMGDLVGLHDPQDLTRGLYFAGRIAEEFKLDSGTFVRGGALRLELIKALSPRVSDLLLCGEGRGSVGVLAWPAPGVDTGDLQAVARLLSAHNAANPGNSTRVARFAFLAEPPNVAAHEVSDKGSINQAPALRRRGADVERLYAETPDPDVVRL